MARETRPKDYPKLKNYQPSKFMLPTSHYDKEKADRAVKFIENLCHTKGKWAGKRFWLLPWQEQLIRDIFGIVKPDGYMMMIHNPMTIAFGDSGEMQKAIDMLSSVKDSIINAYELKTGLSRTKLAHLMDAETWMDAGKAVELGFADGIIKRGGGVEDLEMPQVSMLYSKTAVTNSLMDKIAEKCRIQKEAMAGGIDQQKNETESNNKVKADSLMSRLNLLKNWR